MTITGDDLGVLGNLAGAIGLFDDGSPNSDWFGRPDHYLAQMLSDDDQRTALIAFVDEVLGGEDRTTAPGGTTWLPVVSLRPPDDPMHLDVCVTLDHETPSGGTPRPIRIGLGLAVQTTTPAVTRTTLEIPLFQVDGNGVTASTPFLLGQVGGRIRIGATVVVGPGVIDAIGIDLDIPTNAADTDPSFGLTLTGLQLPGAPEPRDIRVSADGADELDDAVLDLVLSLVRSLVAAPPAIPAPGGPGGPAAPTAHEVLTAVAGMLGLVPGDAIPDFPIASLVEQGPAALTAWLHSLLTDQTQRERWIDYLADLFGAEAEGSEVVFALPGTTIALRVGIRVDTGESGHAQVTPTLGMDLTQPGSTARAEARVDLCTIDLVTGAAVAVPRLGIWASLGAASRQGHRRRRPAPRPGRPAPARLRTRHPAPPDVRGGGRHGGHRRPGVRRPRPDQSGRPDGRCRGGRGRHRGRPPRRPRGRGAGPPRHRQRAGHDSTHPVSGRARHRSGRQAVRALEAAAGRPPWRRGSRPRGPP